MPSRLWSLGILLVAIGIAAHAVGWDTLLWLPRAALDSLVWVPETLIDAVRAAPGTFAVIALGVVLMVVARVMGRRQG